MNDDDDQQALREGVLVPSPPKSIPRSSARVYELTTGLDELGGALSIEGYRFSWQMTVEGKGFNIITSGNNYP